ncbi:MAG: hypothetical protein PW734_04105 [Verrucomicrobium sp.]|nr:hypothetical protein [Verrucomicrobium sp.]
MSSSAQLSGKEVVQDAAQAVALRQRLERAKELDQASRLIHAGSRTASTVRSGTQKMSSAARIATSEAGVRAVSRVAGEEAGRTAAVAGARVAGTALLKKVPIVCSGIMVGEGLWDLGKAGIAAARGGRDAKSFAMQGVLRLAGGGAGLAADVAALGTAGVATPVAIGVTAAGIGAEATAAQLETMRKNGQAATWGDVAKGKVTAAAAVDTWHSVAGAAAKAKDAALHGVSPVSQTPSGQSPTLTDRGIGLLASAHNQVSRWRDEAMSFFSTAGAAHARPDLAAAPGLQPVLSH